MKKTIIFLLTIHCSLFTIHGFAQDFKVTIATSQNWSGGACCRYGTNYVIEVESKSDNITPDTVWINGNYYPLNFSARPYPLNVKSYDSLRHVFIYSIAVGEFHDDA